MTSNRPDLNNKLSSSVFRNYYFLKEELVQFCKNEGLQATGGKEDLTERIAHYLDTGERITDNTQTILPIDIGVITEESFIENNFICSEKHRAFFKLMIGKSFSFNVAFQKWLKSNAGKTYKDAILAYRQIIESKKTSTTVIDKQFEYNTYIRAFFEDNKGKTLDNAIKCWKYKKGLSRHNKYEKTDLIALQ